MAANKTFQGTVVNEREIWHNLCYNDAVSWSQDDRISILTEQSVYIMTLLFPAKTNQSSISYIWTYILAPKNFEPSAKVSSGSSIHGKDVLFKYGTQNVDWITDCHDETIQENSRITEFNNYNSFKAVAWSPIGCDINKRCVLAILSLDLKLNIYFDNSKQWISAADILDIWKETCRSKSYFGITESSMIPQDLKNITLEALPQAKQCLSVLQFMHLAWFPKIMNSSGHQNDSSVDCAVLTTITRSGHVIFWGVQVPVVLEAKVVFIDVFASEMEWPSAVNLIAKDSTSGFLAIGNADGLLKLFSIEFTTESDGGLSVCCSLCSVLWSTKDEMAPIAIRGHCWNENDPMVFYANKNATLLKFSVPVEEGQPSKDPTYQIIRGIHHGPITGLSIDNNGQGYSCDSDGVMQRVNKGSEVPEEILHDSKLSKCCFGICVSPNGLFLMKISSINLYKSKVAKSKVQMISLYDTSYLENTALTPISTISWDIKQALRTLVAQEAPSWPLMYQPLESLDMRSLHLRCFMEQELDKNRQEIRVGSTLEEIYNRLAEARLGSWLHCYAPKIDKFPESDRTSALLMADWLLLHSSSEDSLDLALSAYSVLGLGQTASVALQIREDTIARRKKIKEQEDARGDAQTDANATGIANGTANAEVNNLRDAECDASVDADASAFDLEPERKKERLENTLPVEPNSGNRSKAQSEDRIGGEGTPVRYTTVQTDDRLPAREQCPICRKPINLTDLSRGECSSGHSWKRCAVSFRVCADLKYFRCQECQGCVSLPSNSSSPWLRELLRATTSCPVCQNWLS